MASAPFGGLGPGIFAVVFSGVAVTYLLIEPIYTLRIAETSSAIQLALCCIVGVTIAGGVTLLTRARRQAEDSRERFHRTFAHAYIGLVLANARGGMIEVNRAFCEITGYAERELLGKQVRDITYPEDIEQSARLFDQVATYQLPSAVYENRYVRPDGSPVWVRVSAAAVLGPGGQAPNQVFKSACALRGETREQT